jgi:hypothetical protein
MPQRRSISITRRRKVHRVSLWELRSITLDVFAICWGDASSCTSSIRWFLNCLRRRASLSVRRLAFSAEARSSLISEQAYCSLQVQIQNGRRSPCTTPSGHRERNYRQPTECALRGFGRQFTRLLSRNRRRSCTAANTSNSHNGCGVSPEMFGVRVAKRKSCALRQAGIAASRSNTGEGDCA